MGLPKPFTVVRAQDQLEGAGFLVHRPFPSMALPDMDPFLLLDQMGPSDVAPGEAKGAPDHPHRGFETVTYMIEGLMEHRDSNGNHGRLGPGDVQWMTAGSGVIHSEMPQAEVMERGGRSHGLQLWVNLPAKDKMMAPRYQDIPSARIPEVDVPGGKVRVLSGSFQGTDAVIDTRIPIQYLHAILEAEGAVEVTIPDGHNGFAYVLSGALAAGETHVAEQHLVTLPAGVTTIKAGAAGASAVVLSGPPLREPVARYGPFVMNTREEIYQAVRDYQAGRFGTIPATMEHGERRPYLPGAESPE